MALKHGSEEHFTKWMHMENGKAMVRRLHRLEIQATCGRLHILTGDKLPDALVTSAGQGHKGAHVGQILMNPKKLKEVNGVSFEPDRRWPCSRDAIQWLLGIAFAVFWNFLVTCTHYM